MKGGSNININELIMNTFTKITDKQLVEELNRRENIVVNSDCHDNFPINDIKLADGKIVIEIIEYGARS